MKIIIVSFKKFKITMIFLLIFPCIIIYSLYFYKPNCLQVSNMKDDSNVTQIKRENKLLRGALESIFPHEQKVMYEKPYRPYVNKAPSFQTFALTEVLKKGKSIDFNVIFDNPKYMRPMYVSNWRDTYYRGWLYLPNKISDAHHKLFIFPFGGSSIYDFTGEQGLTDTNVDYHRNLNFLIYNFDINYIKLYENQVALIGEPKRTGAQVISVVQDDLLFKDVNTKDFTFQLTTPKGYESDFIYGNAIKYDYLKKRIEEHTVKGTFSNTNEAMSLQQLQKENLLLTKELSNFIPLEDDIFITRQSCRNASSIPIPNQKHAIQIIKELGKSLDFNIIYQNPQFMRPIYDPIWKENYQDGWAYIPRKICENMHLLFMIPTDIKIHTAFFNNLAFHEKCPPINENKTGFLIFNFTPQRIIQLNNQIIIIGIPQRTGLNVITLNRNNLINNSNYIIQLITPDDLEIDYEILPLD